MDGNRSKQKIVLDDLVELIRKRFGDTFTIVSSSSGHLKFLSICHSTLPHYTNCMTYLPLFYVIATTDDVSQKLTLKLITFNGKIIDQINEADHPLMTNEDKLNFIGKLEKLRLCKGIEMPDADLKLDAKTFSSMYLVERLQQDVVIRSYQCQYALYEDSVCKMCSDLSRAYDFEESLDCINEDGSYEFFDADKDVNMLENPDYCSDTRLNLGNCGDDSPYCDYYYPVCSKLAQNIESIQNASEKNNKNLKMQPIDVKTNTKGKAATVIKCKHCSYRTEDIKELISHNIETHAPNFNGTFSNEISNPKFEAKPKIEFYSDEDQLDDEPKPCPSPICDKVFTRKSSMKLHMKKVHKRQYKCNLCPYETVQESRLSRHVKSVHEKLKRYFCEQCSYAASDNYSLKFHVMSVHEKVKPFICEHCTHATTTQKALTIHIKAVHEKLKPFICEHCSTGFATKYMLQMHVTVVHEKVKCFKCDQCSYQTARKYYLDHHIKSVHEKVKQFKCDLCNFETAVKCNLKNHILAVHEKCKPFQCPHCSFEAIRKKQLNLHLTNVHGKQE